ncbi:MAG: nucleoside hydrolase [Pseudomonadota bacterium]
MVEKLIIDTDPGVDDAMAIFFAMLHPEIELVGLTAIFGNVTVDIATRNAIALSEIGKTPVPVARGADAPLTIKPNPVSDYVHGAEGFGDIPPHPIKGAAVDQTAAAFIVDEINKAPGEITLCPIGPLTNIALALQLDPSIASKVKRVVIMGGAYPMAGNVTDYAEANIWNDPHAADQVFAADWPLTMIGLDVTSQVICTRDDFAQAAKSAPILGGFLAKAADFYIRFYEEHVDVQGCYLHDPAAVIACVRPDLFTLENHAIEVKLSGERIGQTALADDPARVTSQIGAKIDGDKVKALFLDTIASGF